jgi:hypothetical protein
MNSEVANTRVEHRAEDAVAISNEAPDRDVGSERLYDLLSRLRGVWVRGHVDVQNSASLQR